MHCDESYPRAGHHGLLAVIDGALAYIARAGESYIEPVKPTPQHPNIMSGKATQIRANNAEKDLWKCHHAVF